MWESSNELSLFGRNTQAIQIFLLLLPCPSPQAVVLNTGVCSLDFADTAVSLCWVALTALLLKCPLPAPFTRSLHPSRLLGFNTLILIVRLRHVCPLTHSLIYICLEPRGCRMGSSKENLSDVVRSLSLREEGWYSPSTGLCHPRPILSLLCLSSSCPRDRDLLWGPGVQALWHHCSNWKVETYCKLILGRMIK